MKMPDRHHLRTDGEFTGEEDDLDDLLGIDVVAFYSLPLYSWKCCRDSMFGFPPMVEQNLSEDDGGNFAICFSLKKLNYSEQK